MRVFDRCLFVCLAAVAVAVSGCAAVADDTAPEPTARDTAALLTTYCNRDDTMCILHNPLTNAPANHDLVIDFEAVNAMQVSEKGFYAELTYSTTPSDPRTSGTSGVIQEPIAVTAAGTYRVEGANGAFTIPAAAMKPGRLSYALKVFTVSSCTQAYGCLNWGDVAYAPTSPSGRFSVAVQ